MPNPSRIFLARLAGCLLVATLALPGLRNLRPTAASAPLAEPAHSSPALAADFGKLPLYFAENRGQLDDRVACYVQGSDKTLYFTAAGVAFALRVGLNGNR